MVGRDGYVDGQPAMGVQAKELRDSASADPATEQRAPSVAPEAAARACARWQSIWAHPFDLLADGVRQVGLPGPSGALSFLGQHGQRGLQPVGEVPGLCERPPDGLVTGARGGVEVADQGLRLGRTGPLQSAFAAVPDRGKPSAQQVEGRRALRYSPGA